MTAASTRTDREVPQPRGLLLWRGLARRDRLVSLVIIGVLGYLILGPLLTMIRDTFLWSEDDALLYPEATAGDFTFEHWQAVFGPQFLSTLLEPLLNSLLISITTSVLALLIGGILAWIVVRTDVPGRKRLRTLLMVPYMLPSFALALVWITVFKDERLGGGPGLFTEVFGTAPPSWLSFGPIPIIITLTIHYYPFAFATVSGALQTMDSQLEESAEIAGMSRMKILSRITFPLMAPAFLSALVLTFGKALGSFGGPALLGGPIRYYVLPTALFAQLGFGETAGAYILAIVLIAIGSVTVVINAGVLKRKSRYQTVGGKGIKSTPVRLRSWRYPIVVGVVAFAGVWILLPLFLLLLSSLQLSAGIFSWENLGLHYWFGGSDPNLAYGEPGIFQNSTVLSAAGNSILIASLVAVIGSAVGLFVSYIVVRRRSPRLSAVIDHLAFIPLLVPSIALGAMYLSLFAVQRGPIPALYGTIALLVLVAVVKELPFTTRTSASALMQISGELDDAAVVQGVSWRRRFTGIVVPLARSGVVAGAMISFISIMRELSLFILLMTPGTTLLIYLSFSYTKDMIQLANAVMLVIIVITIVFQILIWKLGRGPLARAQKNGQRA